MGSDDEGGGLAHGAASSLWSLKRRRLQQPLLGGEFVLTTSPPAATESLTEMEKQVRALKERNVGMLLLFECGYRMRIFGEDAENASRVLGIQARRHRAFVEASVPVHRTLFHARRLVHAGYKVGIVKQLSVVSSSGQPLERDVVAVYTPATIPPVDALDVDVELDDADDTGCGEDVETDQTDMSNVCSSEDSPRFIFAVIEETLQKTRLFAQPVHELDETLHGTSLVDQVRIGVFGYDIHTGELVFDEFEDDVRRVKLQECLKMVGPVEFVLPAGTISLHTEQTIQTFAERYSVQSQHQNHQQSKCRIERIQIECASKSSLMESRRHATTTPTGWPPLVQLASSAIATYLWSLRIDTTLSPETTRVPNANLLSNKPHLKMQLPDSTQRDLCVFNFEPTHESSLFGVMNQTQTMYGARCLKNWLAAPLTNVESIVKRQDAIERLASVSSDGSAVYECLRDLLPLAAPLERFLQELRLRRASPRSVVRLLQVLAQVERLTTELMLDPVRTSTNLIDELLSSYPRNLGAISAALSAFDVDACENNDYERSISHQQWGKCVDELREYSDVCGKLRAIEQEFKVVLEFCRRELDLPNLEYSSHRNGGIGKTSDHLIAIDRSDLSRVPEDWYVVSSNKSLVRYYPRQVRTLQLQEDILRQMKAQVLRLVWLKTIAEIDDLVYVKGMLCVDVLAQLDTLCSLAAIARIYPNYTRPVFSEGREVRIVDGRHPTLELYTPRGSSYIPGNLTMSTSTTNKGGAAVIISGPNMGGKSTFLRMVGLLALMAHVGSLVPATFMTIPVFDTILSRMHRVATFTRRTACHSSGEDELNELSLLIKRATPKSLVLLDEVGYGLTSPQASLLAFNTVKYLYQSVGCNVLISTHMTDIIRRSQQDRDQSNQVQAKLLAHEITKDSLAEGESSTSIPKVVYHYRDREGVATRSFAIQAAALSGLPVSILKAVAVRPREDQKRTETPRDDAYFD